MSGLEKVNTLLPQETGQGIACQPVTLEELYHDLKERKVLALLDDTSSEQLQLHLPFSKVSDCLAPLCPTTPFIVHILKDKTALIRVKLDKEDVNGLLALDIITSRAIRHGGTLKSDTRAGLDAISPFLAKRITGENNLPLQEVIKASFDPHDVLASDRLFWMRKNQ